MKDALNFGFSVRDTLVVPQASVGIAVYPDHSTDPETLLSYADAAMYRAKAIGRNSLQLFEAEIASHSNRRALMAQALRRAVGADEFSVVYQPRVSPVTGRTTGFEALVRWYDPEQGHVSPSWFVALAEETGLIVSIGERVLEAACRQTAIWAQTVASLPLINWPMAMTFPFPSHGQAISACLPFHISTIIETWKRTRPSLLWQHSRTSPGSQSFAPLCRQAPKACPQARSPRCWMSRRRHSPST